MHSLRILILLPFWALSSFALPLVGKDIEIPPAAITSHAGARLVARNTGPNNGPAWGNALGGFLDRIGVKTQPMVKEQKSPDQVQRPGQAGSSSSSGNTSPKPATGNTGQSVANLGNTIQLSDWFKGKFGDGYVEVKPGELPKTLHEIKLQPKLNPPSIDPGQNAANPRVNSLSNWAKGESGNGWFELKSGEPPKTPNQIQPQPKPNSAATNPSQNVAKPPVIHLPNWFKGEFSNGWRPHDPTKPFLTDNQRLQQCVDGCVAWKLANAKNLGQALSKDKATQDCQGPDHCNVPKTSKVYVHSPQSQPGENQGNNPFSLGLDLSAALSALGPFASKVKAQLSTVTQNLQRSGGNVPKMTSWTMCMAGCLSQTPLNTPEKMESTFHSCTVLKGCGAKAAWMPSSWSKTDLNQVAANVISTVADVVENARQAGGDIAAAVLLAILVVIGVEGATAPA